MESQCLPPLAVRNIISARLSILPEVSGTRGLLFPLEVGKRAVAIAAIFIFYLVAMATTLGVVCQS